MNARLLCAIAAALLLSGCAKPSAPPAPASLSPPELAAQANQVFLSQKTFDPWILTTTDLNRAINPYLCDGSVGSTISPNGKVVTSFQAGRYKNGQLESVTSNIEPPPYAVTQNGQYSQRLDLLNGQLSTDFLTNPATNDGLNGKSINDNGQRQVKYIRNWQGIWHSSDVKIDGDPEAQQVTHANLFYLLSSTYPGSRHSLPPMGLSSTVYGGHIFWDAELWMLPALIVQHPDYAKTVIDYRFDRLPQAKANAKAHGFAGAEYPWESADTGKEVAPPEFSQERHITADVAWAAWRYYLWTGDKQYLQTEGWPVIEACADYWASRVSKKGSAYHILHVLGPDETAGVVDNDAYTVGVVRESLDAAVRCARILGKPVNPTWRQVHDGLSVSIDKARGIPQGSAAPMTDRFAAKQADALLLLHPLNESFDTATQGRMLDFYSTHTIKNGPAMTDAIHAIVAARLGRNAQAFAFFQDSYRPFMRGPWDAFSEKRSTNNVYFLTGMGGCVQSVLYGFAGLNVAQAGETGRGTRLAGDGVASLYAAPRLPSAWKSFTVQGIHFRGHVLTLTVTAGNKLTVHS